MFPLEETSTTKDTSFPNGEDFQCNSFITSNQDQDISTNTNSFVVTNRTPTNKIKAESSRPSSLHMNDKKLPKFFDHDVHHSKNVLTRNKKKIPANRSETTEDSSSRPSVRSNFELPKQHEECPPLPPRQPLSAARQERFCERIEPTNVRFSSVEFHKGASQVFFKQYLINPICDANDSTKKSQNCFGLKNSKIADYCPGEAHNIPILRKKKSERPSNSRPSSGIPRHKRLTKKKRPKKQLSSDDSDI